jgi:hypothetical protein
MVAQAIDEARKRFCAMREMPLRRVLLLGFPFQLGGLTMRDPVLAKHRDDEKRLRFTVHGGLHYIKGNPAPHFSLTADGWDHGSEFGGCCHEIILEHFPQFADLAALHLSDIDGMPMHTLENGFYHLGGTHWERPKFDVAARHFRITEAEARQLVYDLFGDSFSLTGGFLSTGEANKAKARLSQWVDAQRPRWKAEADACVAKHGLVVYGDPWPAVA